MKMSKLFSSVIAAVTSVSIASVVFADGVEDGEANNEGVPFPKKHPSSKVQTNLFLR